MALESTSFACRLLLHGENLLAASSDNSGNRWLCQYKKIFNVSPIGFIRNVTDNSGPRGDESVVKADRMSISEPMMTSKRC